MDAASRRFSAYSSSTADVPLAPPRAPAALPDAPPVTDLAPASDAPSAAVATSPRRRRAVVWAVGFAVVAAIGVAALSSTGRLGKVPWWPSSSTRGGGGGDGSGGGGGGGGGGAAGGKKRGKADLPPEAADPLFTPFRR